MTEFWGWLIASSRRREELLQKARCVCACVAASWWVSTAMFEILTITKANVLFKVYTLSVIDIQKNKHADEENFRIKPFMYQCNQHTHTHSLVHECVCVCVFMFHKLQFVRTSNHYVKLSIHWAQQGVRAHTLTGCQAFVSDTHVMFLILQKKNNQKSILINMNNFSFFCAPYLKTRQTMKIGGCCDIIWVFPHLLPQNITVILAFYINTEK